MPNIEELRRILASAIINVNTKGPRRDDGAQSLESADASVARSRIRHPSQQMVPLTVVRIEDPE